MRDRRADRRPKAVDHAYRPTRGRAAAFLGSLIAAGCGAPDGDSNADIGAAGTSAAPGAGMTPDPSSNAPPRIPGSSDSDKPVESEGAPPVSGLEGAGASEGTSGPGATGPAPPIPSGGSEADYRDPGKGPWEQVPPEECGLDASRLADSNVGNYAIFRYGKMCHIKGGDTAGQMFSATKTLGGTMVGRAAFLTRDVPRTGPGTGTILHEDLATDWLGRVSYNAEATLSHVMAMCGHNRSLELGSKSFAYDTIGSTQINTMIDVTERAIAQVPGLGPSATAFVEQELFERMGMSRSSWSPALGISTGWNANLSDMGKLGTLLLHDGFYGGERLLSRDWVYRMSHPAFEDANTSYGQLAWLNHRGNAAGIGGNISTGANAPLGDPCAPAAFWPSYPHGISESPDCGAEVGTCEQEFDVGVFSAQGLNGQFIVMHPGLDLVIAARNFSGGDGPLGLWRAVRPALVALDPVFQGDEAAFCEAYGAGNYAPDLVLPRQPGG
jgi:hypothetical protein